MNIQNDVSLAGYSTMRLGGQTRHLVEVSSQQELVEAVNWAKQNRLNIITIGGGSNIVWRDEGFDGLVIVNHLLGFEVVEQSEDNSLVKVGAGEDWDSVVERCCKLELSGIECLSLIPGLAGSTPIQNVGAYGQEIASVLVNLQALEISTTKFVDLSPAELDFAYRTSRLKTNPGKYIICSIQLRLTKSSLTTPFYASLQLYLNEHHITDYSPSSIRQAVIDIRSHKLPDPRLINNCGSFFANPIIPSSQIASLESTLDLKIPHWDVGDGQQKVAAAWLIENIGYKDFHDQATGMGTWHNQPLVLVNESAKSTADLLNFRNQIAAKVKSKFNIDLDQEPDLLPLSS